MINVIENIKMVNEKNEKDILGKKLVFINNYELEVILRRVRVRNDNTAIRGSVRIIKRHEI